MCDERTAVAEVQALDRLGLTRRGFARSGALAAAALPGMAAAATPGMVETRVEIPTPDGKADGWLFHATGHARPAIILWPDIAGPREAYRVTARRLAAAGYTVLVVNQYYRSARAPVMATLSEWRTPEGQARLKPMIAAITPAGVASDAVAFVHFLDSRPEVDRRRRIGTVGYCMGGPYAVRTAAAVPARIGAAASMHGGGLVTTAPDSPHRLLARSRAAFLFTIGRNDDATAPADKDALRQAAAAAGRPAEIEVYPADHGWTTLDAPIYDKPQAERAFARMLALFAKL